MFPFYMSNSDGMVKGRAKLEKTGRRETKGVP